MFISAAENLSGQHVQHTKLTILIIRHARTNIFAVIFSDIKMSITLGAFSVSFPRWSERAQLYNVLQCIGKSKNRHFCAFVPYKTVKVEYWGIVFET